MRGRGAAGGARSRGAKRAAANAGPPRAPWRRPAPAQARPEGDTVWQQTLYADAVTPEAAQLGTGPANARAATPRATLPRHAAAAAARDDPEERLRARDLLRLMPDQGRVALDIGAGDGFFSLVLAQRFERVISLDLVRPKLEHPRIDTVQGDAALLQFADKSFDFVLCTGVLQQIERARLAQVGRELQRVCAGSLLVGVPYREDLRIGRTTCTQCNSHNPPHGHVNAFGPRRLASLFAPGSLVETSLVGQRRARTNSLARCLFDFAGNPGGTYGQAERCIHCGNRIVAPPPRTPAQRLLTRLGAWAHSATAWAAPPRARWLHMLLQPPVATRGEHE